MTFTIRDLLFGTAVAALLVARWLDQAATRERELVIERMAHYIDDRFRDHVLVMDGWAAYVDRRLDEDGKHDAMVQSVISTMQTDIGALEGKWPKRKP